MGNKRILRSIRSDLSLRSEAFRESSDASATPEAAEPNINAGMDCRIVLRDIDESRQAWHDDRNRGSTHFPTNAPPVFSPVGELQYCKNDTSAAA